MNIKLDIYYSSKFSEMTKIHHISLSELEILEFVKDKFESDYDGDKVENINVTNIEL